MQSEGTKKMGGNAVQKYSCEVLSSCSFCVCMKLYIFRCIDQLNVCDGHCDCGTECDDEKNCGDGKKKILLRSKYFLSNKNVSVMAF